MTFIIRRHSLVVVTVVAWRFNSRDTFDRREGLEVLDRHFALDWRMSWRYFPIHFYLSVVIESHQRMLIKQNHNTSHLQYILR